MKFEITEGQEIPKCKPVKVKRMKHILEVTSTKFKPKGLQGILKLSNTHYMILATKEVKEYDLSENRADNTASLKHTFKKIRDLINNNFVGAANELHITLTYKENMTDTEQLYIDFKNFWKRYQYKYGKDTDYLSVVEPQGRGAWHCHVLIRHNDKEKVYIPSKDLEELWGHGFIKIKALKGVDNIGAYLSAYLGDVELTVENYFAQNKPEGVEVKTVMIDGEEKKFIKGGRLHLYPVGMNLYRKSKGIVHPEVEEMLYKDLKEIVGTATPNYSSTVKILDEDKVLNEITYEQYNINRLNRE